LKSKPEVGCLSVSHHVTCPCDPGRRSSKPRLGNAKAGGFIRCCRLDYRSRGWLAQNSAAILR